MLSTQAFGETQSGWWWNPIQPGRGFFIEQQGTTIFFAGYLYADNGRASWLSSAMRLTSTNDFSAPLQIFSGGQTLTGPWRQNVEDQPIGQARLQLSATQHALLTWPGGGVQIERAEFVVGGLSSTNSVGTPQTGWWWNSSEPGRGFSIEVQNGVMFLGGFMCDDSSRPIWYLSRAGANDCASAIQRSLVAIRQWTNATRAISSS